MRILPGCTVSNPLLPDNVIACFTINKPLEILLMLIIILVFDPMHVFNGLYRDDCADFRLGSENSNGDTIKIGSAIFRHFGSLFNSINPTTTSAHIRQRALRRFYRSWGGLYSTTCCFFCLNRAPEHMLACRHAMCDNCIVIFGSKSQSAEYHYHIEQCPMCCQEVQLTIRQLPPTKGPNILSLDGGGVRGIIQLGLLRSLEERLGGSFLAWSIDLCGGTSAGKSDLST